MFYNGTPLPLKIAHSHVGCGPPSNTWFLGFSKSSTHQTYGISNALAVLQDSL